MSEGKKKVVYKILLVLLYYVAIPLVASLIGIIIGLGIFAFITIPCTIVIIYKKLPEKIKDWDLIRRVNEIVVILLFLNFTVLVILSSGELDSKLIRDYLFVAAPLFPVWIAQRLAGFTILCFFVSVITYGSAFSLAMEATKKKITIKVWGPVVLIIVACVPIIAYQYIHNRPSVKYAGHGFNYMNGFSSTDFTDYMVTGKNSKLVTLDHKASLWIEDEKDMPVMDGAEACYPLYAALAKACYKDIDRIESETLDTTQKRVNGKIVTFTNTVVGFSRLLVPEAYDKVDLFFGARPSKSQLQDAENAGVELEITPIGKEAFVFFVEDDNPVNGLTSDQIRAIYHGDITNWKEVGGEKQEIVAFQRPNNSGSQTMMQYFMKDVTLKEPKTYEVNNAMTGVVQVVAEYANEDGAMGYSFRYFLEELVQEKGVKMLSVDGVYPSLDNIENGSYPLTVDLVLITRKDDPNPYVAKMRDFILSPDGQYIVRQTGYAALQTK